MDVYGIYVHQENTSDKLNYMLYMVVIKILHCRDTQCVINILVVVKKFWYMHLEYIKVYWQVFSEPQLAISIEAFHKSSVLFKSFWKYASYSIDWSLVQYIHFCCNQYFHGDKKGAWNQ